MDMLLKAATHQLAMSAASNSRVALPAKPDTSQGIVFVRFIVFIVLVQQT